MVLADRAFIIEIGGKGGIQIHRDRVRSFISRTPDSIFGSFGSPLCSHCVPQDILFTAFGEHQICHSTCLPTSSSDLRGSPEGTLGILLCTSIQQLYNNHTTTIQQLYNNSIQQLVLLRFCRKSPLPSGVKQIRKKFIFNSIRLGKAVFPMKLHGNELLYGVVV